MLPSVCNSPFHMDILVIEDDHFVQKNYRLVLTEEGHSVDIAVNGKNIPRLREGGLFINASRGAVTDGQALEVAGVTRALDVWENEPLISTDLFRQVYRGTPHIAGYSLDGKLNGTVMLYRAFCSHFGIRDDGAGKELYPP